MKYRKIYPWVLVALLWGVGLLNYLDRQMLATMRPSMQIDIAELKSATNFGILMGIFMWIYGFMSPVAGLVADRINKKWLIVGSLFVWSGVTYGMGYATTFNQLYWLRAIMGVSEALYIPTALALIADFHTGKTRSLAIGIHMTGLYIGSALGGFGATIAAAYTWHITFHTFGLIGIAYALICLLFLKGKNPDAPIEDNSLKAIKRNPLKDLKLILSNPSFWIILLFFATLSLPGWATKNWLPTLFAKSLHIPMSKAGPMATITISGASFIGVILGGIFSDRWVQRNVKGRIYTSAIGLALTIPSLLLLGFGTNVYHVIAAGICFGFGYGLFDANNMPILCQFVSSKHRGTAYGIMNMVGVFFGAYITEFLGKATDNHSLGKSFAMLSVVVFIVLIIQLGFLKPKANDFTD